MNVLVIKHTSLGDVLHSTGHVRAIKERFPESRLVLMTATTSADIYRHHPDVDELILFDRYKVKQEWLSNPLRCWRHIKTVMQQVRDQQFDLAFDLQGLARTVVFLYFARARQKFVKGNWPGIPGFRNKSLHAIREMDGVLALAGITNQNTEMEFATSQAEESKIDQLLEELNLPRRPLILLSPFSRWPSKDWPLDHFTQAAQQLSAHGQVIFTGAADRQAELESLVSKSQSGNAISLAGKLNLLEFAALVKRADVMLTGDSFPMHIASACNTDVVALFGPTDESKVGPTRETAVVLRAPDCQKCDRKNCQRYCLSRITVQEAVEEVLSRMR
ncbi:MAG: glycosyltransferase family 9 protein [Acidiferrobacterales bacterium]|nr:glycosyltransferase family 9 protein [Acidiferrobacterales bacterium]